MTRYSLFLDEIHTGGGHFDHFSLVGFAISNEDYEKRLIPLINQLKIELFGNMETIIHEKEINSARKSSPFGVFQQTTIRKRFWTRITEIINELNITIFAICIHKEEYAKLYGAGRPMYEVALQLILENYLHFLEQNGSYGDIHVESTNSDPNQQDQQLQQNFHYLKANGTLFYNRLIFQQRIGTISFPPKADNIIGLQLADLLPNSLNRKLTVNRYEQRTFGLIDVIESHFYDGGCDNSSRFGLKIVP